uniref:Uncharacterized protein n=1 Tax=Hemiselmis andersenii TaxID=464988 RepID=A0A7S1DHA4_HEMAN
MEERGRTGQEIRSASSVGLVKDLMEIQGYCDTVQVRVSGAGDGLANGVYRWQRSSTLKVQYCRPVGDQEYVITRSDQDVWTLSINNRTLYTSSEATSTMDDSDVPPPPQEGWVTVSGKEPAPRTESLAPDSFSIFPSSPHLSPAGVRGGGGMNVSPFSSPQMVRSNLRPGGQENQWGAPL